MKTEDYLKSKGYNHITTSKNGIEQFLTENENKPIQCSIGVKSKGRLQYLGIAISTKEQTYLDETNFEDFVLNKQDLDEIKNIYTPNSKSPLKIYTNFGIDIHSENIKDWRKFACIYFIKTTF